MDFTPSTLQIVEMSSSYQGMYSTTKEASVRSGKSSVFRVAVPTVKVAQRMSTLTNMAEPILQMLLPHHQAMCRFAGPELAKAFASLVHAKVVPAYALPNHKVAMEKVPSDLTHGSSSLTTSSGPAAVPIQVQLARLPRPRSTVAYIKDEDTVEADVVSTKDSSPLSNENTNSNGESVCTSFPTELSFANACRQPVRPSNGETQIEMGMGFTKSIDVEDIIQECPPHETSTGTLDWLTDQHASSNSNCKSEEGDTTSTSNNGISASHNGGASSSGGSVEGRNGSISDPAHLTNLLLEVNVEVPGPLFLNEAKKRLYTHILSMAPVSLSSRTIADVHVVVNVEALAMSGLSSSLVATKARMRSRNTVGTVRILDGFCANLNAKSVEFTGMAKVVSIGSGFLAGSFVENVVYGPMPRLRSVGDDWMYLCSRLRSVTFSGDCYKLKTIGSCWMCECGSLLKFRHTAFESVERVGSWWLARCDSLESASFNGMPNLKSVGDWWLSSCAGLEHTNYEELSSLTTVGSGWMYACVSITEVSFSGLISLREVGDNWVSDCTFLASVAHGGLGMLTDVGAYWLSGCCLLNRVSMVGVGKLSSVGPYWLANTCGPRVECDSSNTKRISALISV